MNRPTTKIGRAGLAMLSWIIVAGCNGGDDGPQAGVGGMLAAGSGSIMAGHGGMTGSGGAGAGSMSVPPGGEGGGSGDAAGTGVPVGTPDGSTIDPPDYPSPMLSQSGRGCAIKNDGTMACWDDLLVPYWLNIIEGQFDALYLEHNWLADDLCGHFPSGGYSCEPLNSKVIPPAGREYLQIAIAFDEACGLTADGTVECWGDPVTNVPTGEFVQIDSSRGLFCGLRSDGTGECWHETSAFFLFPEGERFRQIATGGTHVCGITLDYRVVCWGPTILPRTITEPAIAVSVDDDHACAVLEDGRADCFGTFLPTYQPPPADQRFRVIDAGIDADCGITTDLHVWCWGNNLPAREMLDDYDGDPIVVMDW